MSGVSYLVPTIPNITMSPASNRQLVLSRCGGTQSFFSSYRTRPAHRIFRNVWFGSSFVQDGNCSKFQEMRMLSKIRSAAGRRHHKRRDEEVASHLRAEAPQSPDMVQLKNTRGDSVDKVVMSRDMDALKHKTADAVVVAQRAAERSVDKVVRLAKAAARESEGVWRELRTSVRVQKDKNVVISVKHSSLEYAGKAVLGSILLLLFVKGLVGPMRRYRRGWKEGLGRSSRVVQDRSLGGDEGTLDKGATLSTVNQLVDNEKTNVAVHSEHPQHQEQQQQYKTLKNRIIFGVGIGAGFLGVVLAGGWVFTLAFSWAIWIATGEYFELVRSKSNIANGMTPPPPVAAKVCAAICSLMPIMTLYYGGRMGVVVTTSAFGLAAVLLLHKVPRFSQLTSAFFGLIYCGYLPSFWIKLRCGLAVPALNTRVAAGWPILLGGQAHWTVGLVATIVSCSAVAAADTFSFLGGKTFGKTPLIAISPKKTLEGAAVGLSCTVAVTVLLCKLFQWPSSTPSAALLAVIVFMSSLFGDLTESMMKRDAGVKDSGQLIPGHGGILDRVDSYIFTGALVYSFVKIGLPLFGV